MPGQRKIKVRCTFEIEVLVDASIEEETLNFMIELNGCPATGIVGAALKAEMDRCEESSVCWACNLKGKNEIIVEAPCG